MEVRKPHRSLEGRRLVVTGASSGVGAALTRLAVASGAAVAMLARRGHRLGELSQVTGAVPIVCDLVNPEATRRAIDHAASELGGLDGLVNNAGYMALGDIGSARHDEWRTMFEVNVLGLLHATSAALPHLRVDARADIVNVSSMAGRRLAFAETAVYSASKAAVHRLSEGLRAEVRGTGIRVTTISPGTTATELGASMADGELRRGTRARQREVGLRPDDVARQIVRCLGESLGVEWHEIAITASAQHH